MSDFSRIDFGIANLDVLEFDGHDEERLKKLYQKQKSRSIIDIDANEVSNIDNRNRFDTSNILEESIIDIDKVKNDDFADRLIEKLGDTNINSRAYYKKIASLYPHQILEKLAAVTCEMPNVRNKGAYFNHLVKKEFSQDQVTDKSQ